jgi:hypothetical protein
LVTIAGVTPTGYNGTYPITAVGATTISYLNATTGAQTVAGTVSAPAQASITPRSAGTVGLIVQNIASQTASMTAWRASTGSTIAYMASSGDFYATSVRTLNNYNILYEVNTGGALRMARASAAVTPPANTIQLMVVAGTSGSKLIAVGPGGTSYTILDNIV